MNVKDLIERLQTLDPDLVINYVAWDPDTKQFTKWGLSGVTNDALLITGDLIDARTWPDVFE